jgi:hypothetical protein
MRVRVDNPALVPELVAFLERQERGAVTADVGAGVAEVSLLGSYRDEAMRMRLYLLVRSWEAGETGRAAEILA